MSSIKSQWKWRLMFALLAIGGALAVIAVACGGGDPEVVTEIQTVVVEKQVTQVEKVIETVVVEKEVEGKTVTEVQTVVVVATAMPAMEMPAEQSGTLRVGCSEYHSSGIPAKPPEMARKPRQGRVGRGRSDYVPPTHSAGPRRHGPRGPCRVMGSRIGRHIRYVPTSTGRAVPRRLGRVDSGRRGLHVR